MQKGKYTHVSFPNDISVSLLLNLLEKSCCKNTHVAVVTQPLSANADVGLEEEKEEEDTVTSNKSIRKLDGSERI